MKNLLFILILYLFASVTQAAPPILIDPQNGKYLGNLNKNRYDSNSVNNPYGRYGSKYSSDSINNPYGKYGSRYSSDSVNNPYATGSNTRRGRRY